MNLEDNPLLKPEDFMQGYKDKIEQLKNNPEFVSFDKLCYETFSSDIGKKFIEVSTERYLIPPLADRNSTNFATSAIWGEGFKDAFRMIKNCIRSHQQRINAEMNK